MGMKENANKRYNEHMIYSVTGEVLGKDDHYIAVAVGGVAFKVFSTRRTLDMFPVGAKVAFFSHLHVREDALDLYGFPQKDELDLFEMLISVSGVGPKSALTILDIAPMGELTAAIKEGRPDLLTRASGVGRKTAERIIVELKSKVQSKSSEMMVRKMESDADAVEALVGLGYRRDEAKESLRRVSENTTGIEPRLKEALKLLSGKK